MSRVTSYDIELILIFHLGYKGKKKIEHCQIAIDVKWQRLITVHEYEGSGYNGHKC